MAVASRAGISNEPIDQQLFALPTPATRVAPFELLLRRFCCSLRATLAACVRRCSAHSLAATRSGARECLAALGLCACAALVLKKARGRRAGCMHRDMIPAFIISLRRRPAKQASALARAKRAGLQHVEVFDAVDGRELNATRLQERRVRVYPGWRLTGSASRFFKRELKWGEIGCALSHHAIWREIAARCWDVALVLEDDADFAPDFTKRLVEAVEEAQSLYNEGVIDAPDVMYVARRPMCPERDVLLPLSSLRSASTNATRVRLVRPAFSYKMTAYVVFGRGARKLLSSNFLRRLIPVDDLLPVLYDKHDSGPRLARQDLDELYADAPRLNALAVRPLIAWERRGLSDTENSLEIDLAHIL